MTSRERVLRAVNHQVPDRVPIDLGGMKASGIAVSAYDRVKRKLGIATPTKVLDPRFMIAVVEDDVLKRLHVDVVPLDLSGILSMVRPEREWTPRRLFDGTEALFPPGTNIAEDAEGDWVLLNADGSPSTFRMPKNGYYFDDMSFNRGERIDPRKFRPVSDIPDEHLRILSEYGRSLYQNTDYAILGWGFGVCFLGLSLITDRASNVTQGLPNEWMMMLMTEKETCHEMMDRSVEAAHQLPQTGPPGGGRLLLRLGHRLRRQRHAARRVHQPGPVGRDDQAALQEALRLDPRQHDWKTFLHCCGSVYNLHPRISSRPAWTSSTPCRPRRPTWTRAG